MAHSGSDEHRRPGFGRGTTITLHSTAAAGIDGDPRGRRTLQIRVDADACPKPVKEILFRAAERTGVSLTLVANHAMAVPRRPNVRLLQVPGGFDVADSEITGWVAPGDLVVSADIPLAADVIGRGATALNPRGELYSADTIRSLLSMRDFMDTVRASGVVTPGPPALSQADRKAFAGHLDRWLTRRA